MSNKTPTYKFFMYSEEFGEEEFGPYYSVEEAEVAVARIKAKAKELKDGIRRFYSDVVEAQNDEERLDDW